MSDLTQLPMCFVETPEDFADSVSSYERGPIVPPADPVRSLNLEFEYPFTPEETDILLVSVYSETRGIRMRIYDGAPVLGAGIHVQLPAGSDDGEEVYSLAVDLVRKSDYATCGWSREEVFTVPSGAYPQRWHVDLLAEPVETEDGGTRLTRITAL